MNKLFALLITLILQTNGIFASTYDIIVSKDGNGDFKTVQEAFDAVPAFRNVTTTIFIKNGIYKEKLILAEPKKNVKIIGEDKQKTILTYDDYAQKKNKYGEDIGTSGSSSFYCIGNGFQAENITFENSSGPIGQAVAIWIASDMATFVNCRFLGFQDTLYTYGKGARQFFYGCYIEGTVDFIFGSSTAWFEACELHCKKSGYITAASTPETAKYGYIFNNCTITGSQHSAQFYLGRPWRPFAKVIFMNCTLPPLIKPEGWHNWGKESNETTVYYAEYNNNGQGALSQNRVKWSHQLSTAAYQKISLETVFGDWKVSSPHPDPKTLR